MTDSSTAASAGPTEHDTRVAGWAYLAGLERGKILGALAVMSPDEKNKGAFRRREIADRLSEYARNAYELRRTRKHTQYWPKEMPGGWPIPPTIPSDDESTYWPEVNGWPCPPPELRGQDQE